jgi:hypothetical protein
MNVKQQTPARADGLWRRVTRIIDRHPELKQIHLKNSRRQRGVALGFYEPPSEATLERIKSAVRAELAGDWHISIETDGNSPVVHLHKIDNETAEFHRAHPVNEPAVIWKRVRLPAWRNRPFPRPVPRDYRAMLLLAGICGVSALAGFFFSRSGVNTVVMALCFVAAYLAVAGSPRRTCGTRSGNARSTSSF